jgi:hypothetical protein
LTKNIVRESTRTNTVFGCRPGRRPVITPRRIPRNVNPRISRNMVKIGLGIKKVGLI